MAQSSHGRSDRAIRWTTTFSVVVLAVIAAIVSYKHMYLLVQRYGETSWTAMLLPVSVDGMIVASSMTLLSDSRRGRRSGFLPWTLLVIGSAASLAANVAGAEPSAVGRLINAWPSAALIGSYELLMRQVRSVSAPQASDASASSLFQPIENAGASYTSHTKLIEDTANAYATQTNRGDSPGGLQEAQNVNTRMLIRVSDETSASDINGSKPTRSGSGRSASGLQDQAWQWALANSTSVGDLPSGKAIAEAFDRCERWGRLVKRAGLAGRLDPVTDSPNNDASIVTTPASVSAGMPLD